MNKVGEWIMDIVKNPKNQAKVIRNIGDWMHSIATDLDKKGN